MATVLDLFAVGESKTTLKSRVKERLAAVGLTQRKLAEIVGIENPQNITHWLTRENIPGNHLFNVCRVLKCNPEWLLTGAGAPDAGPAARSVGDIQVLEDFIVSAFDAVDAHGAFGRDRRATARLAARAFFLYLQDGHKLDLERVVQLEALEQAESR